MLFVSWASRRSIPGHCLPSSETSPLDDGHNAEPPATSLARFHSGGQGSEGSQTAQTRCRRFDQPQCWGLGSHSLDREEWGVKSTMFPACSPPLDGVNLHLLQKLEKVTVPKGPFFFFFFINNCKLHLLFVISYCRLENNISSPDNFI